MKTTTVTVDEICSKLPICSLFCKDYYICEKRITLNTSRKNEAIDVCIGEQKIDSQYDPRSKL